MDAAEQEAAIVEAARLLADAETRIAFLNAACRGNSDLRQRIETLLADAESADAFFESGQPQFRNEPSPAQPAPAESTGERIGPYKLLEKIGEGGFGMVYMAEQEQPMRRRVALKVIKPGMDTRQVVARFEAERQALAMMEHPNIARVYDGGSTEAGRPYFVLELVRGIPITEFCDRNRLNSEERLKLFISVCQAVQHAHQKGIIHRDLKPTNVLVTLDSGQPLAKVIDFGVAKALHQRLTEKTLFTGFAQMIGTPAYMSPEQAEMSQQDVDTRSDIYSLGVLLYELLTGCQPFPEKRLRSAGWAEMQRIISQEIPPKPSTRLSTMMAEERTSLLEKRGEDLKRIGQVVRRELDWIVMKTLEKDPARRYETANGLAMDVGRYLEGRAIEAAPPTWSYQFYTLARRHKKTFAMAAALAGVLLAASVFSTYQAVRATRAEKVAQANAEEARHQTGVSEAVIKFFKDDILFAGNVWGSKISPTPDLTLQKVLELARKDLDGRFPGQPLVEASVRLVLGEAQGAVADRTEAIRSFRRAYDLFMQERGPAHRDTLKARRMLGWYLAWGGRGSQAEEGEKLLREAYEDGSRLFGEQDSDTLGFMRILGQHYVNHGQLAKAEPLVERAHSIAMNTLGPDAEETLDASYHLASLRHAQARHGEARRVWEDTHRRYKEKHGPRDVRVVNIAREIGFYLWWSDGDFAEAARVLSEALEISTELQGTKYPTDILLYELAQVRIQQADFQEAASVYRRLLDGFNREFGPEHSLTRSAARQIASIHGALADWTNLVAELGRQRQQGITNALLVSWELLARQLGGQTNEAPLLRQALWQQFANDPTQAPRFAAAIVVLVLPSREDELRQILDLSSLAESDPSPSGHWGLLRKPVFEGLGAYRRGQFAEAARTLEPVAHNLDNRRLAVLARYFVAMALKRDGKEAEARKELKDANGLFSRLLRGGTLRPEFPDNESWATYACCLLARDEAETLILGKPDSQPVTKESLNAARQAWKPVHELLIEVNDAARRQDYKAARDLYLRARDHTNFDIEPAFEDAAWMIEWMPVIFAQAGDEEGFVRFLREAFREDVTLPRHYVIPIAYARWGLPKDLHERIAASTDRHMTSTNDKTRHWEFRHIGLALHGLNRNNEALNFLEQATKSQNHDCSVSASAFAGLAAWRLGRIEEATRWVGEAVEGFRIRIEAGQGRLDPNWHHLAVTDLALKEARELMGERYSKAVPAQK